MEVLVIGGTLFIGRRLVKELVRKGHSVTVLHRKPRHGLGREVHSIRADRNDGDAMRAALAGRHFDVVFDNVYDWERGTDAFQIEATVQACGDNLSRYIFMSSVAAYGDGLSHHEGDGLAAEDHPDAYVRNKANSERLLFRMHSGSGLPVVTLRPPFIYGPRNPFYREAFFWDRIRDRRALIVPGDGRRLMQFVHVDDLVWCAIRAMETPAAVGQAFNVANLKPITQVELVEALAKAAKHPVPPLVNIPRRVLLEAGGHAMRPKFYFGEYFDLPPITQIVARAQRVLGFVPMDFADGLRETYRWWARAHPFDKPDYRFEDQLLAARV
ncbi:MAG TPA: NAD-dependent epimerase/dehydratase family protein [Bryobacteraceae bacterium]